MKWNKNLFLKIVIVLMYGHLVQHLSCPLGLLHPLSECLGGGSAARLLIQPSAGAHPDRQQVLSEVAGSLTPTWQTWMEFPASGLAHPNYYRYLGRNIQISLFPFQIKYIKDISSKAVTSTYFKQVFSRCILVNCHMYLVPGFVLFTSCRYPSISVSSSSFYDR